MEEIGFTWDRRRERVRVEMPLFSRIGEDLADGAMGWTVAWLALFRGWDCDAEDGCCAVHAGVGRGCGGGCSRTESGAGGDVFEGGGDGVCAEDVERVARLLRGKLWACGGL